MTKPATTTSQVNIASSTIIYFIFLKKIYTFDKERRFQKANNEHS